MRRFKSFEDFELFLQGYVSALDFLVPCNFRQSEFELVIKTLRFNYSLLGAKKFAFFNPANSVSVYVVIGAHTCGCIEHLTNDEILDFKKQFSVFRVLFTSSSIIVNSL